MLRRSSATEEFFREPRSAASRRIIQGTDEIIGNFKTLSDNLTKISENVITISENVNRGQGTFGKLLTNLRDP